MDTAAEVLYSAEQIKIPEELHGVLKEYSKAVLRNQPDDLFEFSVKYFKDKHDAMTLIPKLEGDDNASLVDS